MKPINIKKLLIALFALVLLFAVSAFTVFAEDGLMPVDGVYQIETSEDLLWFAAKVNAGDNTINGKLITDINLNLGYIFTFDPDTGLVEVEKEGAETVYLGTGIKGTSGGNVQFDGDTVSTAGSFYSQDDSGYITGTAPSELLNWAPIGTSSKPYLGTFEGDGKTVSGIYINRSADIIGLFGYIGDTSSVEGGSVGTVQNVDVANSYIKGGYNVGGLCGNNSGNITNCNSCNTGAVYGNNNVGSVCGVNSGKVTNCNSYNISAVSGSSSVGGVCGANYSNITNCNSCNTGAVSGSNNVGGVCGVNSGKVTNCNNSNTGVVSGTSDNVGGVCGWNSGDVTDCSNTGTVRGSTNVGGMCGRNSGSGTIESCCNTGAVSGDNYVGGVCGVNSSSGGVKNCSNTGTVNSDYSSVGGVCGNNYCGSVINCSNTGTVSGNNNVGGVCGENIKYDTAKAYVTNCYNIGAVSGTGNNIGGVCGYNSNGGITNCYNIGTVIGIGGNVADVCGKDSDIGTITNCFYLNKKEIDSIDGTTAKTSGDFADGSVAWRLNTAGKNVGDEDYTHIGAWSRGMDYPILADDTHKATYKITITGLTQIVYYSDSEGKCAIPETVHVIGADRNNVHITDATYTADAAITGVIPTVTDIISFAYDVTVVKDLTPTLTVTLGSKTVTLTATATGSDDYRNYSFVFEGILPQQMTKNISATLIIDGTEYAKKSQYSMRRYVFNNLPSDNKKLEKFLVNMLYYGAAAQQYLGQTENLATDGLVELLGANTVNNYRTSDNAWKNPSTSSFPSLVSVKAVTDTNVNDLITWKSATLVFDTTITMRLRFTTTADIKSLTGYTFDSSFGDDINITDAVHDTKAAADPNNVDLKTYYIDIEGFKPTDYSTPVTVTLYDSGETPAQKSETVTYSVMSYIANKMDSETMQTLVRALYDYGISGKEYVE